MTSDLPLLHTTLLKYAELYNRNLPLSEYKQIPWLAPMERKLEELLEDPGWYCCANPVSDWVDFFFDPKDKYGFRCVFQVSPKKSKVDRI